MTVDILDDSIHEANETFIAILKASDNVVIGEQSTSVGIISDDDILGNYLRTVATYKCRHAYVHTYIHIYTQAYKCTLTHSHTYIHTHIYHTHIHIINIHCGSNEW